MSSIRHRLTRIIVGGLITLALVAGTGFYVFARWMFVRQFDVSLVAKARALATLVEQDGPGNYEMEFTGEQMPEFVSSASMQYFQVWLPDGQVLRRSPNLDGADLPLLKGNSERTVVEDVRLPGGKAGRAVRYTFRPNTDDNRPALGPDGQLLGEATVVLARSRTELDQVLASLLMVTLAGALAIPLLAALVVSAGVRKGLRPVLDLAGEMQKIDSPTTAAPLKEEDYPEELQPVVSQLNSLMDRLNTAFLRERRFTMDASHELRTPLAEAAMALEVAASWPDDHALMLDANRDALQAVRHMDVMVAALLALARGDGGLLDVRMEYQDIEALLTAVWTRLESRATKRGVAMRLEGGRGGTGVMADRVLLTSVLQNLLDNAIEYSVQGTAVTVILYEREQADQVELSISNCMEKPLTASDVKCMFEPFWRYDKARSGSNEREEFGGHSGLGLALASTLCHAMDVEISASVDKDKVVMKLVFARADLKEIPLDLAPRARAGDQEPVS